MALTSEQQKVAKQMRRASMEHLDKMVRRTELRHQTGLVYTGHTKPPKDTAPTTHRPGQPIFRRPTAKAQ